MRITATIGKLGRWILNGLVHLLSVLGIHPNVLTLIGLAVNGAAAWMLASGEFPLRGPDHPGGAVFDLTDGEVARHANKVTKFGGFLDSVMDATQT